MGKARLLKGKFWKTHSHHAAGRGVIVCTVPVSAKEQCADQRRPQDLPAKASTAKRGRDSSPGRRRCAVGRSVLAGQPLPTRGFVRQEPSDFAQFLANRFGQHLQLSMSIHFQALFDTLERPGRVMSWDLLPSVSGPIAAPRNRTAELAKRSQCIHDRGVCCKSWSPTRPPT